MTKHLTGPIMELERSLSEGPIDMPMQLRLIDSFIRQHQPEFDLLKPAVSACRRGASRFEWVDSVLLKAISEGEWAVFENANICNPSVLDRLNPLLEEGNQTMVINEQGLDDVTQRLRVVEAHTSFRAIFILSRKSLVEQGRDVSRALRNRCLELSITFKQPDSNDYDGALHDSRINLEAEQLDPRNLDWSLTKLQTRFDLLPCPDNDFADPDYDTAPVV